MSASKYIKGWGFPSLKFVANKANIDRVKLHRWYHSNYTLFEVVVAGVYKLDVDASLQNIHDQAHKDHLTDEDKELILSINKRNGRC